MPQLLLRLFDTDIHFCLLLSHPFHLSQLISLPAITLIHQNIHLFTPYLPSLHPILPLPSIHLPKHLNLTLAELLILIRLKSLPHPIMTLLLKTMYILLEGKIVLRCVEDSHVVDVGLAIVETAFAGAAAVVVDAVLFEVGRVHV